MTNFYLCYSRRQHISCIYIHNQPNTICWEARLFQHIPDQNHWEDKGVSQFSVIFALNNIANDWSHANLIITNTLKKKKYRQEVNMKATNWGKSKGSPQSLCKNVSVFLRAFFSCFCISLWTCLLVLYYIINRHNHKQINNKEN